ncbi:serine hydrolase [Aquimarina sp. 2201CG14-23]|uniref:serine hydrolase n=1 Tax=Aquimarina mycalae TaxID=3040073 RepID=UPI002477F3F4|nr:serine hydrolase [Aquimarina sp. 2201CG14-23]MDH7448148.1 serine hydrolase [Aquimarina sp. 2201CG14-23]
MSKSILILVLSLIGLFSKQMATNLDKTNTDMHSVVKDSLTTTLHNANKDGELVGFSVAIIDQNNILYNKGFGYSDSKNKKKYQTNTIQNVGSISKTFIGSKDLLIGHNGSCKGSLAMMYFNPETKIGKTLMINTDIDYKEETVVPYIKYVWK